MTVPTTRGRPRITVTLQLGSLGGIPESTADHNTPANVEAFLDAGGADMPLAEQIAIFGKDNIMSMIRQEFESWLEDLATQPSDIGVAIEHV